MFDLYEFAAWLLLKFPLVKPKHQQEIFKIIHKHCANETVTSSIVQEQSESSLSEKQQINEQINKSLTSEGDILKDIILNNAKLFSKISKNNKKIIEKKLSDKFNRLKFPRKKETLKNIAMLYIFNNKSKYKKRFKELPTELRAEVIDFFQKMEALPNFNTVNIVFLSHVIDFTLKCYYGGNSVSEKDHRNRTFLHLTARVNYLNGFRKCLEVLPSETINAIDYFGRTPLEYAAKADSIEIFKFYFPDGITESHIPLLFYAVEVGAVKVVPYLLSAKFPKKLLIDNEGNNLLHIALLSEKIEMLRIIIKFDKNLVNKPNKAKKTPLEIVSEMTYMVYDTQKNDIDKNRILAILAQMIDIMVANGGVTNFTAAIRYEENFQTGKIDISSLPHLKHKVQQTKRRKFYLTFLFVSGTVLTTLAIILFVIGMVSTYLYTPAGIALCLGVTSAVLAMLDAKDIVRLDKLFSKMFKASFAWANRLPFIFRSRLTLENDIELRILQQTEETEKLLSKDYTYQTLLSLGNRDQSVKGEVQVSAVHQAMFKYLSELNLVLMQNVNSKSSEIMDQIKIFIELINTQIEKLNNDESVFVVVATINIALDKYLNQPISKVGNEVEEFKQFLLETKKDLQKLIEKHFPNEELKSSGDELLSLEDSDRNKDDDSSLSLHRKR